MTKIQTISRLKIVEELKKIYCYKKFSSFENSYKFQEILLIPYSLFLIPYSLFAIKFEKILNLPAHLLIILNSLNPLFTAAASPSISEV
jgi:hypothetical protein